MTVKKIAVVGTGANGAAFGSDMIGAGLDVTFIEQWPAHVDAMRTDGLKVETPEETTAEESSDGDSGTKPKDS